MLPIPLLAISGEQGSAKTVLSKMLKALIDPSAAPVRALPRDQSKFPIGAKGTSPSCSSNRRAYRPTAANRARTGIVTSRPTRVRSYCP